MADPVITRGEIPFDVLASADAAIAQIGLRIGGQELYASGTAKRHPDDEPNQEVARLVALERALGRLHRKVKRQADGLVKHADDMRADKAQKRANGNTPLQVGQMYRLSDLPVGSVYAHPEPGFGLFKIVSKSYLGRQPLNGFLPCLLLRMTITPTGEPNVWVALTGTESCRLVALPGGK